MHTFLDGHIPPGYSNSNADTLPLGRTGSGTKLAFKRLAKDRPCSDSRLMEFCIRSGCWILARYTYSDQPGFMMI